MLLKKVGSWKEVSNALEKSAEALDDARRDATRQEAQFLRGKIVSGMREQAPGGVPFKPLTSETIAVRKLKGFSGTKALIKRGDLRNSIRVKEDEDGNVFIGVQRTERSADGKSLVDIAEIHEYGSKPIVIEMTPKMRAMLMAAFRKAGLPYKPGSGTGIIVSQIPARPFIRPVFDKFGGAQSRDRIEKTMQKLLKGVLS